MPGLGRPVIVPHHVALVASLRPERAIAAWQWLESEGLFTPLNNVESLTIVDEGSCDNVVWNELKGSWNLGLQTLGWGRLSVGDDHPLYRALEDNEMLLRGYRTMWLPGCETWLPVALREGGSRGLAQRAQ